MEKPRILYVEDDSITRMMLKSRLKVKYPDIHDASNGAEGLRLYKELQPDLIITDISMPVMNGHDMIKNIREMGSDVKIIIVSAYNDNEYDARDCIVLDKPIVIQKLINTIEAVV